MRKHLFFSLYRGLTAICRPILGVYLKRRVKQGKEDPVRYTEKMARPSHPRPTDVAVVWVHAVSVGESVSALPLIQGLVDKGVFVVVTTGTRTGADMMARRLPKGAIHQYAPLDCTPWIRAFLCHWQPSKVMVLESELWYNMLREIHKQHIPLYLVNARLSNKSIRTWQKYTDIAQPMLAYFTKIYPQNKITLQVIQDILDKDTTEFLGNLKYASPPVSVCPKQVQHITSQIGNRPVWLVASSHPEDETIVAQSLPYIYKHYPDMLTLIVPRHPERLAEIRETFCAYTQAVRSKNNPISNTTQIYIADTMGELPLFYTISPLCLVGGSFADKYGGHNPLESARYNSAILQGYDTHNFTDVTDALNRVQGHRQVENAHDLASTVCEMLTDTQKRQTMAKNAKQFVNTQHSIVEKLLHSMGVS